MEWVKEGATVTPLVYILAPPASCIRLTCSVYSQKEQQILGPLGKLSWFCPIECLIYYAFILISEAPITYHCLISSKKVWHDFMSPWFGHVLLPFPRFSHLAGVYHSYLYAWLLLSLSTSLPWLPLLYSIIFCIWNQNLASSNFSKLQKKTLRSR